MLRVLRRSKPVHFQEIRKINPRREVARRPLLRTDPLLRHLHLEPQILHRPGNPRVLVRDRIVPLPWHHRLHNNIPVAIITVDPHPHTTIRLLLLNRFITMKLLVEKVADPIQQNLCIAIDTTINLLIIRWYHPREQVGTIQLNIAATTIISDMMMICITIIGNVPRTVDRITMMETIIIVGISVTGVRVAVTTTRLVVFVVEKNGVAVEIAAVGGHLRRALRAGGAMIAITITINTKCEDQPKQHQQQQREGK